MANPSFRAAGTQVNGSGTTISVPPPTGHQAGDLLILIVDTWDTTTAATPSGWALVGSGDSGAWGTSNRDRSYVFWKLAASSSEPNVSVVQPVSGLPQGQMFAVKDVHQTTPIDVSAGWAAPSTSTSVPTPAITTVTDNALIVYILDDVGSSGSPTPPSGTTLQVVGTNYITRICWADITKTPAGTKAADAYTRFITQPAHTFAFAVRPAAAAAPVADFTGTPLAGTAPLSVTFTDASTGTPTSWAWTFGDGGTSTSQNPSHSYTSPGVYTVVLVATNAGGSNTKTRTGYVTVASGFVPQIAIVN